MMDFLVRPFIVKVPGVTGCPEGVSYLPHAGNELTLYSWESLSIPSAHVLKFAAERLVLREGECRVESHAHVGNWWFWSSASSRRDWVSSTKSVSSWMESGRAASGRAVENARIGFTLKGETRRKRASIEVDYGREGAIRIKASETVTESRSPAQNLFVFLLVVESGVVGVEAF